MERKKKEHRNKIAGTFKVLKNTSCKCEVNLGFTSASRLRNNLVTRKNNKYYKIQYTNKLNEKTKIGRFNCIFKYV